MLGYDHERGNKVIYGLQVSKKYISRLVSSGLFVVVCSCVTSSVPALRHAWARDNARGVNLWVIP